MRYSRRKTERQLRKLTKQALKRKRHTGSMRYCDRNSRLNFRTFRATHVCRLCLHTSSLAGRCPKCRISLTWAGITGRPPKKGKKKAWERFWKMLDANEFHPEGCR